MNYNRHGKQHAALDKAEAKSMAQVLIGKTCSRRPTRFGNVQPEMHWLLRVPGTPLLRHDDPCTSRVPQNLLPACSSSKHDFRFFGAAGGSKRVQISKAYLGTCSRICDVCMAKAGGNGHLQNEQDQMACCGGKPYVSTRGCAGCMPISSMRLRSLSNVLQSCTHVHVQEALSLMLKI